MQGRGNVPQIPADLANTRQIEKNLKSKQQYKIQTAENTQFIWVHFFLHDNKFSRSDGPEAGRHCRQYLVGSYRI